MPRTTVGARGERTIHLVDGDVTILYTNRALMDAERILDCGIIEVLNSFSQERISITQTAQLLLAGMRAARIDARAGGSPPQMADATAVMDEIGFTATIEAVMGAIADVIGYDRDEGDDFDPNP
jgi:hypothetical protein